MSGFLQVENLLRRAGLSSGDYRMEIFGNLFTRVAYQMNLPAEELARHELDHVDPGHPLLICVRAVKPLSMQWCVECHNNPAPHIRDRKLVTNLGWTPDGDALAIGRSFMEKYHVNTRTDCSTCHR